MAAPKEEDLATLKAEMKRDPTLGKFAKMVAVGLPVDSVVHKMTAESISAADMQVCVWVGVCVHTRARAHTHTHAHAHIHTYTPTHAHPHIHTCSASSGSSVGGPLALALVLVLVPGQGQGRVRVRVGPASVPVAGQRRPSSVRSLGR